MSSNPKIVVLKTREIIYTLLLLFLAVLLIVCLVLMFSGRLKKEESPDAAAERVQTVQETEAPSGPGRFTAGIYTTPVTLGESTIDVEVSVDQDHINAIRLVNLSEATEAAFPLVTPSFDHITSQILEKQTLEGITCPQENRYTSQLLLSAISDALDRARAAQ